MITGAPWTALADEAADDLAKMQGDWVPAEALLNGKPLPAELVKTMRLMITGDKYRVLSGEQTDEGQLTVDAAKKPRQMDIVGTAGPNKGKTIPAIYEITGDGMRICYGLGGGTRPTEFKSEEGGKGVVFLVTYKKAAK